MSDTTYNGWHNYETWVVNLWLDNAESSSDFDDWARECLQDAIDSNESDIRPSAKYELSKRIETYVDELQEISDVKTSGMFADLIEHALGMVDWYEIASGHIDEIEVFSAGCNMPGYLPDSDPSMFIDADDALEYIKDLMRQNSDDWNEADVDAIEDISADKSGEFGVTAHGMHYFIQKI